MISYKKLTEGIKSLNSYEFSISNHMDAELLQEKILNSEDPNEFNDYLSSDIISAFLNTHDYVNGKYSSKLKTLFLKARRVRKRRFL